MHVLETFKKYLLSLPQKPSQATVKNYLLDVKKFITWFEATYKEIFTPEKISITTISEYKTQATHTFSQASIERHISSLRKFFKFLKLEGILSTNPFEVLSENQKQEKQDQWNVNGFKNYLYVYNASHLTIKNYIIDLKQFISWICSTYNTTTQEQHTRSLFTLDSINAYKHALLDNNTFSIASINRKLSSLRKYIAWASDQGIVAKTSDMQPFEKIAVETLLSQNPIDVFVKEKEVEQTVVLPKKYSSFPPIRLLQKVIYGMTNLIDTIVITQIIKVIKGVSYRYWTIRGKPLFAQTKAGNQQGPRTSVENIKKIVYAPEKISIAHFPWYKKLIHIFQFTRPEWYKRYHAYAVTHYFHLAALFVFCTVIGVGLYSAFARNAQNSPTLASAPVAPPRILSFQGRLTDSSDNPITTPTDLRFTIYNDSVATGAALLWQEVDYQVAPDSDGIFQLLLGNNTTIPQSLFAQNAALYLGITVKATGELNPRQQIATVPYATNAEVLQGLPPTTDAAWLSGSNSNYAVLALDGTGGGGVIHLNPTSSTNTVTMTSTTGQVTLTGKTLALTTAATTNSNVQLIPDGIGFVDIQKPITNSTQNNNIRSAGGASTAAGAVEVDKLFAVLATSSGQSAFTVNQDGLGPIISASHSGTGIFTVDNSGGITDASYTNNGSLLYTTTTGLISQTTVGSNGQCLQSVGGGTPIWGSCGSAGGSSPFKEVAASGVIVPLNTTEDFLVGGTSTSSASPAIFAIVGSAVTGGSNIPTASISATSGTNNGNGIILGGDGSIQSIRNNQLTIGGATTGNIILKPLNGGTGSTVTFNANTLALGGTNTSITNSGTNTLTLNSGSTGNLQFFGTSNYLTNSGTLQLAGNIYLPVAGGVDGYWQLASNVIAPSNTINDLVLGGNSTASAKFHVFGASGNTLIGSTATSALAALDARATAYTTPVASFSGATGFSTLVLDQTGVGDIFTASNAGAPKFTIANDGTIRNSLIPNLNNTYDLGTSNLQWRTIYATTLNVSNIFQPVSGGTSGFWQLANNVIAPSNVINDLTVGGNATASAAWQVFGETVSGVSAVAGTATSSGNLAFRGATTRVDLLNGASLGVYNSVGGNGGLASNPTLFISPATIPAFSNLGSVGIGTSTPLALSGLDIEKNALVNAAFVVNQLGTGDIFTASVSGTTKARIDNSGIFYASKFIDIDNSNNQYLIDPSSTGTSASLSGALMFAPATGGTTVKNGLLNGSSWGIYNSVGGDGASGANLSTNPTLYIASGKSGTNGNVGIGTSNPFGMLDVEGSGGVYGTNLKNILQLVNTDSNVANNGVNIDFSANTGSSINPIASISALTTTSSWYNTSYVYKKQITILHSQVNGGADLTNFPVLISFTDTALRTVANGGSVQNSNGYDIIFVDSTNSTKLDHEIEKYNATTGEIEMWVRIPTLSASVDTLVNMYYDNSLISTTQANPTGVWDASSQAVYHLSDNAANTNVADSTSNANTGVNAANTSTKSTTGKVANGLTYNGTTDKTTISNTIPLANASFTVSAWAKQSATGSYRFIFTQGTAGTTDKNLQFGFTNADKFTLAFYGDDAVSTNAYTDTTAFHYWTATYDSATKARLLYMDGTSIAIGSGGTAGANYSGTGNSYLGFQNGATGPFPGVIDETHVATTIRTAGWIATEYNNQSTPGSFVSVGTQTSQSYGGALAFSIASPGTIPTERLRINSNGNVGIGIATPSAALDVAHTSLTNFASPSGYLYRKPVTINNTGNASTLTNYQVLITIDTASLVTAGKMQSTCADIIFTDSDGLTYLPYWVESGCNTSSTRIWVKVNNTTIPASSNKTIYFNYGNSGAASASNGTNTFDFFDDFHTGAAPDSTLWNTYTCGGGTNTETTDSQGNELKLDCAQVYTKTYQITNGIIESRWKATGSNLREISTFGRLNSNTAGVDHYADANAQETQDNSTSTHAIQIANATAANTNFSISTSTMYTSRFTLNGTSLTYVTFLDNFGTQQATVNTTSSSLSSGYIGLRTDGGGSGGRVGWWNWIHVRQFTSTEPTTSLGTEVSAGGSLNHTLFVDAFNTGNVGINDNNPSNTLKVNGSLCVKSSAGACAGSTAGTIYASNTTVQSADYAENYISAEQLSPGEVVSLSDDTNNQAIAKTTFTYQPTMLGVVSTNPGVTLNSDAHTDASHPYLYPVALSGRVPVVISTSNGAIAKGDYITSSQTRGVGMKATQAGFVIGKALEAFDPSAGPTGKIMVAIAPTWYDPDVLLSKVSDTSFVINGDFPHYYTLMDVLGNPVKRVGQYAQLAVSQLRAGILTAQEIVTNSLSIATDSVSIAGVSLHDYVLGVVTSALDNRQQTGSITSPITKFETLHTNIISPLSSDSVVVNGKLTVGHPELAEGSSSTSANSNDVLLDVQGSASIAGTLHTNNLAVNNDATISGTLHAGKIVADDIVGLSEKLSSLSAQNITNVTNIYLSTTSGQQRASSNEQLGNLPSASQSGLPGNSVISSIARDPNGISPAFDAVRNDNFTDLASFSAYLAYVPQLQANTATFMQGLTSFGPTTLSDTSIAGQLAIGGQLILADNSINVLGGNLNLQPLRQGGINIAGGIIAIDSNGNLKTSGNVTITGTLATNIISPLAGNDLSITLPGHPERSEGSSQGGSSAMPQNDNGTNLLIKNASGSAVVSFDSLGNIIASGEATFSKLNLSLAQPAFALSTIEVAASGSAGTTQINLHQKEITIDNALVTEKSLIYITPVGDTNGFTPFLIRQNPGVSFTVGVSAFTNNPVKFNWLVVN